jgi:uncharacterized protein (DUF697 family)
MKSLFSSRIFWAQVIALVGSFMAVYGVDLPQEQQAEIVQGLVVITSLVTIGLRVVTSKAVSLFGKK